MGNLEHFYNAQEMSQYTANYDPVPEGLYSAVIEKAEIKNSEKSQGSTWLELTWTILGPSQAGRKIFDRITLANNSQKAVDIGRQAIASLQEIFGTLITDTSQLLNRGAQIRVKIEKDKTGQYDDSNRISKYSVMTQDPMTPKTNPSYQQVPVAPSAPSCFTQAPSAAMGRSPVQNRKPNWAK